MRILRHLHENDVIYCDLKPANILVQPRDDDLKLRFCDFEGVYFGKRDASGVLNAERNRVGTIKATPNYCPPELLYDKDITEKWDVYSYGCTMYMLYTENRPRQIKQELFSDRVIVHSKKERAQREKRFKDIEECENAGFLTSHDAMCSPDIPWYMKRVIADCLTHDPDIRPTSQEIEFKMKEVIERIYYKSRFEFYKTKAELAFLRNSLKILIPLEPYLQPLKLFMS
jgi:serine/threonine protein kinase